ncbi:hypothetical protein [Chelatococcus composti]|uniref:Putative nuclease with TOPRIM domain n=1 Tax=Chelatococcus composti TaxID=1743235 RepID=A0A841K2Z2_9HYPH|nr:hypothetical protein [Chelatococcus composti]MBB6167118.1 putative nuclease with TOPRIM domain [Chelatococcus composti]MBS7735327.1 hypothetical protein [Chelatococcus composti]GGG29305.1 hypothetical protein GCM10008026_07330 [Chelatococcus composti]
MPLFPEEQPTGLEFREVTGRPEPNPFAGYEPTIGDTIRSAFRMENSVASLIRALEAQQRAPADPDHNPLETIRGTRYERDYIDRFLTSRNEEETRSIMARIDAEERDRQILEDAGGWGIAAGIAAGVIDPLIFLPGAGLVRSVRGGYSIAKSAGLVGLAGGLQATVSEAALQASQVTRTPEESLINIGTATLLSGLIGGGAAALLSRAERRALEAALDVDRAALSRQAGVEEPSVRDGFAMPAFAGAAATDPRELRLVSFGLDRVPVIGDLIKRTSPTLRIFSSDNVPAKRAMADLSETVLRFEDNTLGIPTSLGGPPVSRIVTLQKVRAAIETSDTLRDTFIRYRYGDQAPNTAPIARSNLDDLLGRNGDKLSYSDFKREVTRALMSGDVHPIVEVQEAAQKLRANILKPLERDLKAAGLLPEDVDGPKGDPSWFARIWNKSVIAARRHDFKKRIVDWLAAEQAEKVAARERIMELVAERDRLEAAIAKLEAKQERLAARTADLESRLDERGMEVRRTAARTDALEERASLIAEEISELAEFIDAMKAELRSPELTEQLRELERELAALRRADKPITEADLDKIEKEEKRSILIGDVRTAINILTGRNKSHRLPSFLAWMAKNGGIVDDHGEVVAILGDARAVVGLVRKTGRGRTIDEWGEYLYDHFGFAFPDGRPSYNEVLRIIDEAQRGNPPWWFLVDENGQPTKAARVDEMVRILDDMAREAGVDPQTADDWYYLLRGESVPRTLDDLERELAAMEAVGQPVPPGARAEQVAGIIAARREAIADIRAARDKAIRAGRRKARQLGIAEARVDEAALAERANRGRLGILSDRLDRAQEKRAILERARALADEAMEKTRARLEEELRGWKGNSAADAVAALKARDEAAAGRAEDAPRLRAADRAVDRAARRIVETDYDWTPDEIASRADEIIDRILGSPDGRLPYDIASPQPGGVRQSDDLRGSLKSRDFAIPTQLVWDFVEQDVEHVMSTVMRTVLPDLHLTTRFGDVNMTEQMRRINEASAAKAAAAKTEAERIAIEKERNQLIRDLAATRDRIRGIYGWSADRRMLGRVSAAARAWNTIADLGGATVNSFADAAGVVFRYGFERVLADGWRPFFARLVGRSQVYGAAKRQARAMGVAIETQLNLRAHQLNDLIEGYRPDTRFERALQWGANRSQLVNFQGPWTDAVKTIAYSVASSEHLRMIRRVVEGRASKRDITMLAENNIDAAMAERIWKAFNEEGGGEVVDGVRLPNTGAWQDRGAALAFEAAMGKEADALVVTPGLERPLWMSDPIWSLLGQFKSFIAAANERLLIANLQRADAAALQGLIFSVALGMLSYRAYTWAAGQDASDRPQDWIKEGLSRSGVMGWFDEVNSLTAKATRGQLDAFRLIGADRPLSRYASRSVLSALLGPTAGKIEKVSQVTGAAATGEWTASDTTALRRLMFFQNLFWIRRLLDQVEDGVNNAFGIPDRVR